MRHRASDPSGLKMHNDAVWVTNTNDGTLVRIRVTGDGGPGAIKAVATGDTGTGPFRVAVIGEREPRWPPERVGRRGFVCLQAL